MVTKEQLQEVRLALRGVLRGLRGRGGPDLGDRRLGRRHVAVLAHVGRDGPCAVSDVADTLGLTLPAASMLTRELEDAGLIERREDPGDRRRTLVAVEAKTAKAVAAWLDARDRPFRAALASLDDREREAFLKGLRALADALMEESARGPVRSHHCPPHRRGPHRHRPV
jgi:DNA-binding MarR family transcriptional regulator